MANDESRPSLGGSHRRAWRGGGAAAMLGLAGTSLHAAPAPRVVSAEEALAEHHALTSIGPDPCRGATGDEIVVCGQRTNRYEVPLYRDAGERYDSPGTASGGAIAAKRAAAPCHARGEACLEPLVVISVPLGPRRKAPVRLGSGRIGEE